MSECVGNPEDRFFSGRGSCNKDLATDSELATLEFENSAGSWVSVKFVCLTVYCICKIKDAAWFP